MKLHPSDPRYGYTTVDDLFEKPLNQMLVKVLKKQRIPISNWFTQGSRFSGKTHSILDFIMKTFLSSQAYGVNCVFYIVRKKQNQLNKMKTQMFKDFWSKYNFKVESGAGKNFRGGTINQLQFKNNVICFETLNNDKIKLADGGAVGGTTWSEADYIFMFFEECSQLNQDLVDQFSDTTRGGINTQKFSFFASNPWKKSHWFTQIMLNNLPEDGLAMEKKGYQFSKKEYIDGQQALFIRNNVLTNPYVPMEQVLKLRGYKEVHLQKYNISYLGLCGVSEGTLYSANLDKMKEIDWGRFRSKGIGKWQVGIDWGEGKSVFASPTTMHLLQVDNVFGAQVYKEYTHWNNGRPGSSSTISKPLSQVEQFDKMIRTLIDWQSWIGGMKITCFIDTGASTEFHRMFNDRLVAYHNISPYQIECRVADKNVPIEDRVLTTNILLAKGLLRIDRKECPQLIDALENCTQVEVENPTEDGRFMRSHQETHWINSGCEYGLGEYQWTLSKGHSDIYENRKD
ncbi:MAG: phage terminase large subunit [Mycoplasmoidaceae bacterium]